MLFNFNSGVTKLLEFVAKEKLIFTSVKLQNAKVWELTHTTLSQKIWSLTARAPMIKYKKLVISNKMHLTDYVRDTVFL